MDNILGILMTQLLHGGPETMAVLVLVIIILLVDRRRLIKDINQKDERLSRIVDDYYKGNLTLSEALNSVKLVLYEIKLQIR